MLGKVRLAKWYTTLPSKTKITTVRDVTQLVLNRKPKMCNVLEYKGKKVIYRRYASLFFIAEIDATDNELATLEILHRYVEALDKLFENVCELDLIFNFELAYYILDELILGGELQETSKTALVQAVQSAARKERDELVAEGLASAGLL
ncbi:AP-1 adaptor complex sigma subunit Aps1 [Leucoagaricus gongylophorus]